MSSKMGGECSVVKGNLLGRWWRRGSAELDDILKGAALFRFQTKIEVRRKLSKVKVGQDLNQMRSENGESQV